MNVLRSTNIRDMVIHSKTIVKSDSWVTILSEGGTGVPAILNYTCERRKVT